MNQSILLIDLKMICTLIVLLGSVRGNNIGIFLRGTTPVLLKQKWQQDVLPRDLAKSRSCDMWVYSNLLALKFDRRHGSNAAVAPVEFRKDNRGTEEMNKQHTDPGRPADVTRIKLSKIKLCPYFVIGTRYTKAE